MSRPAPSGWSTALSETETGPALYQPLPAGGAGFTTEVDVGAALSFGNRSRVVRSSASNVPFAFCSVMPTR